VLAVEDVMSETKIPTVPGVREEPLSPGHQENPVPPEPPKKLGPVGDFLENHFRHYNSRSVIDAAQAMIQLLDDGGKMFLAMAGAMSTAEIGVSLAEMIRKDKIHAISCTGANLEEDLFNLIAHSKYVNIPSWRSLTDDDEQALLDAGLPRVTDVSIPEEEAMNTVSKIVLEYWQKADEAGEQFFPHEFLYQCIRDGCFDEDFEIDPQDSWLMAACKKKLPIFIGGWEDSTTGNMFAACCMKGEIKNPNTVKGGIEAMISLCEWYAKESKPNGIGFLEVGGGIAGDFPICCVPLLKVDMKLDDEVPFWKLYCQISDAHASYGGYSGAALNEKITWAKIESETPRFQIQSDATIVLPLLFGYILGK
jgi:deoxyhypusine synthase